MDAQLKCSCSDCNRVIIFYDVSDVNVITPERIKDTCTYFKWQAEPSILCPVHKPS